MTLKVQVLLIVALYTPIIANAQLYKLPPEDIDLIGVTREILADPDSFPVDIARKYKIGQDEFSWANPSLKRWLPVSSESPVNVVIPTRHILPAAQRKEVVINLAERRLYYYIPETQRYRTAMVVTFPISIGKIGWETPTTHAVVVSRQANPSWYPPESIKTEARKFGVELPEVVLPGPKNPLGKHAIYLDLPGYLLHGTSNPEAIGLRVTHGCIRLYPDDIKFLFDNLPTNSKVNIVHEPVKIGWNANKLFIEVHEPLEELNMTSEELFELAIEFVNKALDERPVTTVSSDKIHRAIEQKSGIPIIISSTTFDLR